MGFCCICTQYRSIRSLNAVLRLKVYARVFCRQAFPPQTLLHFPNCAMATVPLVICYSLWGKWFLWQFRIMCKALNSGHLQQSYMSTKDFVSLSLMHAVIPAVCTELHTHLLTFKYNPSAWCPTCLFRSILKFITTRKLGTLIMPFHLDLNVTPCCWNGKKKKLLSAFFQLC